MYIGGYDFWAQPRSTQTTPAQFLDQVLNLIIRSQWPDMVVVVDCQDEDYTLVYRDQAALAAWDKDGGILENMESLVSLDKADGGYYFVVGSREGPMGAFLLAELGITKGYWDQDPYNRECLVYVEGREEYEARIQAECDADYS